MRENRQISETTKRPPYIVCNADGSSAAELADLPSVATYLTTYGTERDIIATECQNWNIWHGKKERARDRLTLDEALRTLRDRRTAMQRAQLCNANTQRLHNDATYAGCYPADWHP